MNYIFFTYVFNYHQSGYVEKLSGMPSSQAAIKKKENYIVLGGNKKGGKLSGSNYLKAVYLGFIIQGQFYA